VTKIQAVPAAALADESAQLVAADALLSQALEALERVQHAEDEEERAAALFTFYTLLEAEAGTALEAIRQETGLTFLRSAAVLQDRDHRRELVDREGQNWFDRVARAQRDLEFEGGMRERRG
jgi:hypothetical protein